MAEVLSKQQILIAANKRLQNAQDQGRDRVHFFAAPLVAAALGVNDTMGSGVPIPAGARLFQSTISCAAGSAGQLFDVGIRDFVTKVVIDQTAIGNGIAVNAAGTFVANNGTKVSGGVDYVTTQMAEVFITNRGAAGPANFQFNVRTAYLGA